MALTTIFAISQNALIIGITALYKALSTVVAAIIVTNNDVPTTVPTSFKTGNKLLNTSIIVWTNGIICSLILLAVCMNTSSNGCSAFFTASKVGLNSLNLSISHLTPSATAGIATSAIHPNAPCTIG